LCVADDVVVQGSRPFTGSRYKVLTDPDGVLEYNPQWWTCRGGRADTQGYWHLECNMACEAWENFQNLSY
jgi:hypothetical protein